MSPLLPGEAEFLLYQSDDGQTRVEVRFDGETAWLSLGQMAELFQRDKSVISRHVKNVFDEGELERSAVVADSATTALDGKSYQVEYFNLDMIISRLACFRAAGKNRRSRSPAFTPGTARCQTAAVRRLRRHAATLGQFGRGGSRRCRRKVAPPALARGVLCQLRTPSCGSTPLQAGRANCCARADTQSHA